jgi:hypothetical protein
MRFPRASAVVSVFVLASTLLVPALQQTQESDRKVAGGGISAPGWQGKVDAAAAKQGMSTSDSKFEKQGNAYHVTTGPASVYWNPANVAKGDFSVKATFREPKQTFSHPHPYGIFIGGSNLDSDQPNLAYCVAYRDGTFLVRGFSGGSVTTFAKRQPNEAVHKAASTDAEVTQEVGWNVKDGRAECVINGTVVAGFDKSEITGPGKLESTDGVVGLRFTHNTDVIVTNFTLSK